MTITDADCEQVFGTIPAFAIAYPDWDERGRVHNWKTYIPEDVRASWDALGYMGRWAAYRVAREMADSEEWD